MALFRNPKRLISLVLAILSVCMLFTGWLTVSKSLRQESFFGISAEDIIGELSYYTDDLIDELEDLDVPSAKLNSIKKSVSDTIACVSDLKISPIELVTICNTAQKVIKLAKKYDDGWFLDEDTASILNKVSTGILAYKVVFFAALLLGLITVVCLILDKGKKVGIAYFVLDCILVLVFALGVSKGNGALNEDLGMKIITLTLWPFIGLILALPCWPSVLGKAVHEGSPVAAGSAAAVCGSCGAPMKEGTAFCGMCGAPASAPAGRFCPGCGQPMKPEWAFCPNCGPVAAKAPAKWKCLRCGTENEPDNSYCYICGQKK